MLFSFENKTTGHCKELVFKAINRRDIKPYEKMHTLSHSEYYVFSFWKKIFYRNKASQKHVFNVLKTISLAAAGSRSC